MTDWRDRKLFGSPMGPLRVGAALYVLGIAYLLLCALVAILWHAQIMHSLSHPSTNRHDLAWDAGMTGLMGAAIGEVASIRASLLKAGHLWPWQARKGTKPLGLGKYSAVLAMDLLFGFLAGVLLYGEHVGLNPDTWKGTITLLFAGMSGPEIIHRLGGTIRK
jgi:hypothetical protein